MYVVRTFKYSSCIFIEYLLVEIFNILIAIYTKSTYQKTSMPTYFISSYSSVVRIIELKYRNMLQRKVQTGVIRDIYLTIKINVHLLTKQISSLFLL